MPFWSDLYKLWTYAFEKDPLSRRTDDSGISGAGVTQPEAIPDIRQDGSFWGGGKGLVRLRDTNDFIDLSTVSNRKSRYKEYERLRNVPEIETAMTVFADEACLAGATKIATVAEGLVSIKKLAETKTEPFLVYCWDFEKNDYTIGWAYDPRYVKTDKTIKITLDNGRFFTCTPDHRVLKRNGQFIEAGEITEGTELMPFYRIPANYEKTQIKTKQFPRIFTFTDGWKHERQFIDEWRLGRRIEKYSKVNAACRALAAGLSTRKIAKIMDHQWCSIDSWIAKEGFSTSELKWLGKKEDVRRVIGVHKERTEDVYDLSVEKHMNFCGDSCVFHNCQRGDNNHVFDIVVKDDDVKKELDFLFFHRKMLNMDRRIWSRSKNLFIMGDEFWEIVIDPDNPKDGVLKIQELPPDSMFRIETTKGKLVEFQQAKEGPDYQALTKAPIPQATESSIQQSKALRFTPDQIVHMKIGDDRKTFYPYGQSLIEPARGPAHQLRLMEDAMVVYRLSRAPERRVFYIDVGTLPPYKAEAFIERLKDQFRKKKVSSRTASGATGASAVEERWHARAADEDYWLPIRPNANTRIDTLPGAQNLGEIDDAVYFRNKLFTALNFPKNYMSNEDVQTTRIALSAQDCKFARLVERLQSHVEDGLWTVAERHLKLRGFPEESFEDLIIKLTPPSDWRELSRAEVVTNRINNANSLKGSMLMSDYDILTQWMKLNENEADDMMSRMKVQKLEDMKLQVLAQNPQLLGVGVPGIGDQEVSAEGPSQMPQQPPEGGAPPEMGAEPQAQPQGGTPPPTSSGITLPKPSTDDLKKYDLQIQTYSSEQDHEDIDFSV
jgi:hypothetical protein